jgi:hypothetical protein
MLNFQMTPTTVVDSFVFLNTSTRPIEVRRISRIVNVNSTSATCDVRKIPVSAAGVAGAAVTAGSSMLLSGAMALSGLTANAWTDVDLSTTRDNLLVSPGEKISFATGGVKTNLAGTMTIVYVVL